MTGKESTEGRLDGDWGFGRREACRRRFHGWCGRHLRKVGWLNSDDVPPLPPVSKVLGAAYNRYVWIYDQSFQTASYVFSNLDLVRCVLINLYHTLQS